MEPHLDVDGAKVSEAALPPNVSRTNSWTLTLGNFDGDLDSVHVSRALPSTVPDTTAPTPTLVTASTSVTAPFAVTATFDEPVTGLTSGDVMATNAAVTGFSGSGSAYAFTVVPASEGVVSVSLPAAAATDAAGNPSLASNVLNIAYTLPPLPGEGDYSPDADTIALYHFDGNFNDASANGLTLAASGSVQIANGAARFDAVGDRLTVTIPDSLVLPSGGQPLTLEARIFPRAWLAWSVDNLPVVSLYQEWNSHLVLEDQKWGGNPRGPVIRSSNGTLLDAASWAAAAPLGQWHTLRIVFDGAQTVSCRIDGTLVGSASLPPSVGRTNDWTLTLGNFDGDIDEVYLTRSVIADGPDVTPPDVTVSTPSTTVNGPFQVSVSFDENVTGVELTDFIVANGFPYSLSGSGANYAFTVYPAGAGSVTVRMLAGSATDAAGNANTASNLLTVTYDDSPPPPPGVDEHVADADTVALYHFNNGFADACANRADLTAAGSVALADDNLGWMASPAGKVARFGGAGATLTAAIPDSLLMSAADPRPLTIEARIYPRAWVGYAVDNLPVVSLYQEWDTSLGLYDSKWGSNPKGPRVTSADIPIVTAAQFAAAAPPDAWSLLQISYDGTGTVSAWINGQQAGSVAIAPNRDRVSDWLLTLGNFSGDLDEVIVHRKDPIGSPAVVETLSAATAVVLEALADKNPGGALSALEADPDSDGWCNQLEAALGSDPMGPEIPKISAGLDHDGNPTITIPVPSTAERTESGFCTVAFDYVIETTDNLTRWQPAGVTPIHVEPMPDGFDIVTLQINTPQDQRHFARLRVNVR